MGTVMMRLARQLLLPVAAGLVLLPGCSIGYNGAWSLKGSDRKQVTEYEKFRAERDQQALDYQRRNAQVGFEAAESQRAIGTLPPEIDLTRPAPLERFASDQRIEDRRGPRRPSPVQPLGLFGDVPAGEDRRTSPMDSTQNVRQITFTAEGADFDPAVDPTGKWVAFASTRHRASADIYVQRVDGTTVTQLTTDPGNDVMPAFSPDGGQIAYCSDRNGNWDIFVMDVAGGQSVQVTHAATHEIHPSFSADGAQLVYSTFNSQSGQWEVVVIDVDNPARKRFVTHGLFPSWSPVDNRILFQRSRQRGTRWFSVWTIDLVDDQAMQATEIAASYNAAIITPNWSPDGRHIVFSTVIDPQADGSQRPEQADVWIVAADGTSRINLTNSRFANLQPTWSSDGSIYFVSNRGEGGVENIWSIRPDHGLQVAEALGNPQVRSAQAASDGKDAPAAQPRIDDAADAVNAAQPQPQRVEDKPAQGATWEQQINRLREFQQIPQESSVMAPTDNP